MAYIPCSVLAKGEAARVVQFGHGFLQTRGEALWELRALAHETASVVWAVLCAGLHIYRFVYMYMYK